MFTIHQKSQGKSEPCLGKAGSPQKMSALWTYEDQVIESEYKKYDMYSVKCCFACIYGYIQVYNTIIYYLMAHEAYIFRAILCDGQSDPNLHLFFPWR